jgi:hypothetical protein
VTFSFTDYALKTKLSGDFGVHTRAAVERIQRTHGLQLNGVIGPATPNEPQGMNATKRTRLLRVVAVTSLLSLTFSAYGASVKNPDVKLNSNPRMRYEITAAVKGALGAFEAIGGHVDYKVMNPACVPLTPYNGATVEPKKALPVVYERTGDGVYKGVVYVDQVQDEDYFGLGVCHWSIVGATADFHHGQVNFSPAIYLKDILAGTEVVRYFSLHSYENVSHDSIDVGAPSKSAYNEPERTFTITLKAAEKLQ